jgi:ABC-type branched-subunit amino acid transport system substrate-binding protein
MHFIQSLARPMMVAALALMGLTAQAQEGVSKTSIVIGQSVALIGPGSALAAPFHAGAKLYFDKVNAAGGVHGRKIELVTLDDRGSPAITETNTRKLLDQGVFALFGYYGSPQVTKAYPLIKGTEVLMFAPMSAADEFHGAAYGNVYSIRPGYAEEAAAIIRHAQALGMRKLAIVYASDSESMAALDSAERTMPSMGATLVVKSPMGSGNVANSVDKALAAKPEAILVIADANGAAGAIRDIRAKGFRGPLYGYSNTGESLLAEEVGAEGAGVVVVRVVPKSENPKTAVVRELLADAQSAKAGKPNVYMVEGYLAARVFTEALKAIPRDPTRARLRKAIEGLDNLSVGGFRAHFVDDRTGSKLVELGLIDSQGKIRE